MDIIQVGYDDLDWTSCFRPRKSAKQ